jgi:hypothetical protein
VHGGQYSTISISSVARWLIIWPNNSKETAEIYSVAEKKLKAVKLQSLAKSDRKKSTNNYFVNILRRN